MQPRSVRTWTTVSVTLLCLGSVVGVACPSPAQGPSAGATAATGPRRPPATEPATGSAPGPATAPAPGPATGNPLAAMSDYARQMNRAMNAMLRGKTPREAFAPVVVHPTLRAVQRKLRRAGVRSALLIFQELEITFHAPATANGPVIMFKLGVAPWPTPAVGQVIYQRLGHSQAYRPKQEISRFETAGAGKGAGAPLGRVARAVLREVRAGRCGKLPLVKPAAWRSLLPTRKEQADLARDTASARRDLIPACRGVSRLSGHRINLMPDDMAFAALGPSGRWKGTIRCDPGWQGSPPRLRIRSCVFFPKKPRSR